MATGLRIYTSNDASAPQLFGNSGGLTTVLDAVLVNGYGSQSAAGASPGAGAWAITFTASGKRVYRPAAGNRYYLRVNDAAAGTGGAKEALIKGGESFSDVDTPTNPLPATGQSALTQNSLVVRKSATADSITGRPWIVAADDRMVMMFINTGDIANEYFPWMWGDFYSNLTSDSYRTLIIARFLENLGTVATTNDLFGYAQVANTTVLGGHYIQRAYTGSGTSLATNKTPNPLGTTGNNQVMIGTIAGPNPADSSYPLMPIQLCNATDGWRGRLRGLWMVNTTFASVNDGDTLSGVGNLAGKTFRVIKAIANGAGAIAIETSDTLDTSV